MKVQRFFIFEQNKTKGKEPLTYLVISIEQVRETPPLKIEPDWRSSQKTDPTTERSSVLN
jgi:hypothetical protein